LNVKHPKVKLRSVLFFALFFFSIAKVCHAQAVEEPPISEEPAKEEQIAEPPISDAPAVEQKEEEPNKKKKKKSIIKEEEAASEEHAVAEAPSEEQAAPEKIKKKKEKKKKKKEEQSAPPQENAVEGEQTAPETDGLAPEDEVPDEAAPAEPAKLEDDGKKDTWFRIFKMKRCPIKSCDTKMVHTHEGKKFRGRKKLKIIQNPKTGELVREPVTDPKEHKKSPKVRKKREYQKKFKLPKKSIKN
jgi:hypothetical protein